MTLSKHYIVGLTGGIGSGKTTVAKLFAELNIDSVDADDIAKEVVAPGSDCLQKITSHFGQEILQADGSLDRKKLRTIIFDTPAERKWLESITHPAIRQGILERLQATCSDYTLLVHPLLFETQQNQLCQATIAISVPLSTQIDRVSIRDNTDPQSVQKIIDTQLADSARRNMADYVLENTGNTSNLNARVYALHKTILHRKHETKCNQ